MSSFRYLVTDLRTGDQLCEALPLTVDTIPDSILSVPRLSGSVDLADRMFAAAGDEDDGLDPEYVTTPKRAVIWPMRDDRPVGCFLVWGRPGYSAGATTMSIQADRIDSLLDARLVRATLQFAQVDQLDIARDLWRYALGRPLLYAVDQPPSKGPAADVPWLRLDPALSGVLRDRLDVDGYQGSSRKQISALVSELGAVENGFERRIDYAIDPDTSRPFATVRFGYPTLGTSYWDNGLVFEHPGNVDELTLDEDAYSSANLVDLLGTGEGDARVIGTAVDTTETDDGLPLLEYAHSDSDETSLINAGDKASAQLADRLGVNEGWKLRVAADADPTFGSYVPGDGILARVTDQRWSLREVLLRITGWEMHPSASSVDTVDLIVTNP